MSRKSNARRAARARPAFTSSIATSAASARTHDASALEWWAYCAWGIGVVFVAMVAYLALGPGGRVALVCYGPARAGLELVTFLTLVWGVAWSAWRRPFVQRRRIVPFLCLIAVIGVSGYPIPYPTPHAGHESALCFRLPLEEECTVFWGGETHDENRLAGYFPDRRYGLDLVMSEQGATHRAAGTVASDFYIHGREVHAPCDGRVARVQDGIEDGVPGIYDSAVELFGNHIVLEVAPGQYLFVCHLARASLAVAEGQNVKAGELLGRVGGSGCSMVTPEPHLALHLQDTPDAHHGQAIPWRFCDYLANGARVERGLPRGGIGRDGTLLGERIKPFSPARR